jgi:hypothetical protein
MNWVLELLFLVGDYFTLSGVSSPSFALVHGCLNKDTMLLVMDEISKTMLPGIRSI